MASNHSHGTEVDALFADVYIAPWEDFGAGSATIYESDLALVPYSVYRNPYFTLRVRIASYRLGIRSRQHRPPNTPCRRESGLGIDYKPNRILKSLPDLKSWGITRSALSRCSRVYRDHGICPM